jgi:hypothetical protein
MLKTADVDRFASDLEANACKVKRDRHAGTVQAFDGDKVVFWALQKGGGGPWIARFTDSDRITWARPEA